MRPPDDRRYAKSHVWVRREADGDVRIGFTHVPCSFLRDIVHVEFPAPGTDVAAGEPVGLVEASTAVCELIVPLSGIVVEANPALESAPEAIATEPYGAGWLLAIRPSDPAEVDALLTCEEYERLAAEEA